RPNPYWCGYRPGAAGRRLPPPPQAIVLHDALAGGVSPARPWQTHQTPPQPKPRAQNLPPPRFPFPFSFKQKLTICCGAQTLSKDIHPSSRRHLAVRRARADTGSKRGSHISRMRAVAVRDIANQLSLGRIAPKTSFVSRNNLIFRTATPKPAPLVPLFQITRKEPLDRPRPDGLGFLS